MQEIKYFNQNLQNTLCASKDSYNLIIYYIILRKIKKEDDAQKCLEMFYRQIAKELTINPELLNRNKKWTKTLLMRAKDYADTYWLNESVMANLNNTNNNNQCQKFEEYQYKFDYFGYNKLTFLKEEEFIVCYIVSTLGLNFRLIGKILDLTEHMVSNHFSNGRVKIDSLSK